MTSDEVFEAISHPMRIEILRLLSRRPIRFADLKRRLKIKSSGLLDFHLKKMGNIITTNGEGLYTLNERGFAALQAVDVVSKYGWQRRAYLISLGAYILMNVSVVFVTTFWFLVFIPSTLWIIFYSYWTFVKRRVRLIERNND